MIDRIIGVHRTADLSPSVPIRTRRRDGGIADVVANDACGECLVPRDRVGQYIIELIPYPIMDIRLVTDRLTEIGQMSQPESEVSGSQE